MAEPSDEELIQLFQKGDRTAFRVLIQRHDRHLFRIARSLVLNDQEAEDVVQETYFRAFTHLSDFRGEATLSTWLARIALNEAMRRRGRLNLADDIGAEAEGRGGTRSEPRSIESQERSPESTVARKEVRQILEQAIDSLPDIFRTVFVLRDVEELNVKEAARLLGIREETVKTRLHRARRILREIITEQLASAIKDVFPFAGARCDRLIEALWNRLVRVSIVRLGPQAR